MIGEFLNTGIDLRPTSALTAERTSYMPPVESASYWSYAVNTVVVPLLPTAAIMYQVAHGRETALLDEYEALQANWDGYDADPISEDACSAAKSFLVSLPSSFESPDLCPNPSGTISMEWESSNGQAQLELGRSKFSFYLRQKGAATVYQRGDSKLASSVYGLLAMLYANPRPRSITNIEY
ncbi:hypothetical protein BBJ41_12890 [Burkholderia stabilis]|uniref:hypothetical protein n=1 Tax=Burkholderia stabilis TaxID=95485 RepID=UPI000851BCED|nr:hypothetical protein [Burkholderia stabilis]AOR68346.1 hypothetical protein BBJ41_12890 [Burkholderia stabilis]HDR9495531.1 hypothetical protein [Burkholderia stabilis]HDR9526644.1 hypothetical protein [Burkholderia stabilis]HDR9534126.1 hypothetical protein [Burkholderia stabilis]HDR9540656.1 hypothetical protein [Burkholderia stabilis]